MLAISQQPRMSIQEYLEWEPHQDLRHEYINGEVFAMTGGTIPHNDVAFNLASGLKNHLKGSKCRVNIAGAEVGVSDTGPFTYPDVVVSCHPKDKKAIKFIQFPSLIVEVLSPSTEAYDRGGKFQLYRQIQTLQEYVLISADKIGLDCFRLNDRGLWELHPFVEGDNVHLVSVDFTFPLSLVYEDVF